jgi:dTDP-4-amino-4,6-dideoxygalactose transaminase
MIGPGELTATFERELAAAHGYKHCICLNSGQSALMIALKAWSIREGRPLSVALPAVTYISSWAAVIQAGCKPILVDVTSDARANIIYDYVPSEIDVVMPVHLFGRAVDKPAKMADSFSKCILEDACESAYAPGVGFGDALCLSFYSSHTITTGFGGAVLTNDDDLYFKMWQLVNHGRVSHDDRTNVANLADRFTFDEIGWSLKFSDLNAAVGLGQHLGREKNIKTRQMIANVLKEELSKYPWLETAPEDGHTWMMFPIVLDQNISRPLASETRDQVVAHLNSHDIETRMMMPLTNQPVVKEYYKDANLETTYPHANYLNQMGFYVGCHPAMTEEHVERIAKAFEEIAE